MAAPISQSQSQPRLPFLGDTAVSVFWQPSVVPPQGHSGAAVGSSAAVRPSGAPLSFKRRPEAKAGSLLEVAGPERIATNRRDGVLLAVTMGSGREPASSR